MYETLSKTGDNDRTQKWCKYPILTYRICFFLDKSQFKSLPLESRRPVLVQILFNSRNITYYPLLIGGFFNAGYWAYVAFTCSSNNSFHHSNAPVSYLLPLTKMLSWTNNFHLLFIYKQNIARLSSTPDLRTKQRQRSLTHIFHSIHNNQSSTKDTVWQ